MSSARAQGIKMLYYVIVYVYIERVLGRGAVRGEEGYTVVYQT